MRLVATEYLSLDGAFEDASFPAGVGVNDRYLGWGVGFPDFDLDGWPDLLIVNGHVYPEADRAGARYSYEQRKLLYRNLGNGRFEDVSPRAGSGPVESDRGPDRLPSAGGERAQPQLKLGHPVEHFISK